MRELDLVLGKLHGVALMLVSPGSAFSIYALLFAFSAAFVWLAIGRKRRRGDFQLKVVARGVLSSRLLKSRSTRADLVYFFVNTLALGGLIGWGLFSADSIAAFVEKAAGAPPTRPVAAAAPRILATLLLFLAYEFGYWLDHYCKHKLAFLWALHKTHHTAEVLTPLTLFRVHPLDTLIFSNIVALCVGTAMGLINSVAGGRVAAFEVDGVNVILFVFIYALVQLQHSQFWIAFAGKLGFFLLSPAHHQIHHSIDPAHYNSNFGGTLAIFDWAFGALRLPPRENPHLRFGVSEDAVAPHELTALLLTPIADSIRFIARNLAVLRSKRRRLALNFLSKSL